MRSIHGRCLCGAVTLDVHDPQMLLACHVQVADKAAWHHIGGEAPQHPQFPG